MSTAYGFFELLEEAHRHGRDCKHLWDEKKSFKEFLMQYNLIKEYQSKETKDTHPAMAKALKEKGYTIREIAKILGYKHPGSVSYLLTKQP